MRPSVLILIAIGTVNLGSVCEAMQVNSVRILGRTQDMSVAEIRHAIADFVRDSSDKAKPAALEVINKTEMRACLPQRDLGWVSMRLLPRVEVDGRKHLAWSVGDCCGIQDPPDALRVIRAAEQVYIFPIKNSWKPYRDNKQMRLLDQEARKQLVRLLGQQSDWWAGGYSGVLVIPTRDIGFVFRHGRDEVVLFFADDTLQGTLNGKNTSGLLDGKRHEQFEAWKRRYAQQELPSKQR
jgi:hypothetical protein